MGFSPSSVDQNAVLFPQAPNSKLQFSTLHPQSYPQPRSGGRPGQLQFQNSLCFCRFIFDDVQPGQQEQDFGDGWNLGIKKEANFHSPLIQPNSILGSIRLLG